MFYRYFGQILRDLQLIYCDGIWGRFILSVNLRAICTATSEMVFSLIKYLYSVSNLGSSKSLIIDWFPLIFLDKLTSFNASLSAGVIHVHSVLYSY